MASRPPVLSGTFGAYSGGKTHVEERHDELPVITEELAGAAPQEPADAAQPVKPAESPHWWDGIGEWFN